MSTHAQERVEERLTLAGWVAEDRDKLFSFAERWAANTDARSEAVRLASLPELVGEYGGEESNGNEVWAIYRFKQLVTVMLRRSHQPDRNLRCDVVTRLV